MLEEVEALKHPSIHPNGCEARALGCGELPSGLFPPPGKELVGRNHKPFGSLLQGG